MSVELQLLGASQVIVDGLGSPFGTEQRHRLLAYLALRGQWVQRTQLARLFYPDREPKSARSNLRKLLHDARALPWATRTRSAVEDEADSVRWVVGTDVARLTHAVRESRWRDADRCYRGTLALALDDRRNPDWTDWLDAERRRCLALWQRAAHALLATEPLASALLLTERLLDADPLDEEALQTQLRVLTLLGRRSEGQLRYREFARRLADEIGLEPSVATRVLASPETTGPNPADMPPPGERFIGRERELAELAALVTRADVRCVTVTGVGGIGKSSLVKQAVRRLAPLFADGVRWIALDDLTAPEHVAPRIAIELRLALSPKSDPEESVAAALRDKRLLLVFDNCEHLPALAPCVARWLDASPGLKVLATSRGRFAIAAEVLLPLRGLATPPLQANAAQFIGSEAVSLFAAQASAIEPGFRVDTQAEAVTQLVRAVGGLPLALLLAASWVRLLPMADLAAEVQASLDLLQLRDPDDQGEERAEHRSVRATFESSWRLLAPVEQRTLAALSVFVAPAARAAALAVADTSLPVLGALIDKSLLEADRLGRLALHPLIQQFAAEKLAADGRRCPAVWQRFARWIADFMAQFDPFEAREQAAAVRAIECELPNLRATWRWSIEQRQPELLRRCAVGLGNYFQLRGPVPEGLLLLTNAQAMIEALQPIDARALGCIAIERASLHFQVGEFAAVERAAETARAAAQTLGDDYALRSATNTLALAALRLGRLEQADAMLSEALASATRNGAEVEQGLYACNLINIRRELGHPEQAEAMAERALELLQKSGNTVGEYSTLHELGICALDRGDMATAIALGSRSLQLIDGAGFSRSRTHVLTLLARASWQAADLPAAQRYAAEAMADLARGSNPAQEPACRATLMDVALAAGNRPQAQQQLQAAVAAAQRIETDAAVGFVVAAGARWLAVCGQDEQALLCIQWVLQHSSKNLYQRQRRQQMAQELAERLPRAAQTAATERAATLDAGAVLRLLAGWIESGG